jgi:hypothetical protein
MFVKKFYSTGPWTVFETFDDVLIENITMTEIVYFEEILIFEFKKGIIIRRVVRTESGF